MRMLLMRLGVAGSGFTLAAALGITVAEGRAELAQLTQCDVAVIGGGVVGLAIARDLAVLGERVVLLEKDSALVAGLAS